ncbi:MAG: phosphate signaling complex protein PhoU [Chloroflexi bacterium]|nr:phosphate signaling complex protein PhoU [Chloroflexota bacterium]
MPRDAYQRELQHLHDQVLILGSMVDKAVDEAIQSLARRDFDRARGVIDEDRVVNGKRFEIEEQAIRVIATQQPMASDLRATVAILYIIVDLERIGDYAVGIAKITLMHADKPLLKPLVDLPRMAEKARDMLRRALDAFVAHSVEPARAIAQEDDEVDALYDQVYRELLTYMMADPHTIDRATWLLWVAHNLERIADRVTNICERVVYEATGQMVEINVSTY